MESKEISKLIFIGVSALVIFCEAVFLFWFVSGSLKEINSNSNIIQNLTLETESLERAVSVLNSVNLGKLSDDLSLAEIALPSEKRVTGLVSGLTNLASSSGTQVLKIEISFGKVSSRSGAIDPRALQSENKDVLLANDVVGIPLTLDVEADVLQALVLVGRIQEAMPLLGIKEIEYSLLGDKKKGQLSVLIYSQKGEVFKKSLVNKITPLSSKEIGFLEALRGKTNILQ